jgi:hypothetical protein
MYRTGSVFFMNYSSGDLTLYWSMKKGVVIFIDAYASIKGSTNNWDRLRQISLH